MIEQPYTYKKSGEQPNNNLNENHTDSSRLSDLLRPIYRNVLDQKSTPSNIFNSIMHANRSALSTLNVIIIRPFMFVYGGSTPVDTIARVAIIYSVK